MSSPKNEVRVRLSAEGVKEVVAAFKRIEAEAGKAGRSGVKGFTLLNGALGQTKSLLATLGLTVTVAGLISMGKSAIQVADNMDDLAASSGTTSETFSVLAVEAEREGIANEKLSGTLVKLSKNLEELQKGSKGQVEAFAELGLTAQDFIGLDSGQAFALIAEHLAKMESGTKKTALTTALLGKGAAELIPVLNNLGTKGFAVAYEEARRMGLVVDDAMIAASAAVERSTAQMKQQARGLATQFTTGLAPAIVSTLQDITSGFAGNASEAKQWGQSTGEAIRDIVGLLKILLENGRPLIELFLAVKALKFGRAVVAELTIVIAKIKAATTALAGFEAAARAIGPLLVVFGGIDVASKALSEFKKNLDIKLQAKDFILNQRMAAAENAGFADTLIASRDALDKMTKDQRDSYQQRLTASIAYWDAELQLASQRPESAAFAMEAAKQTRERREALAALTEAQRVATVAVAEIRSQDTANLAAELTKQKALLDKAESDLKAATARRAALALKFRELIADINAKPAKADEDLTVLDVIRQIQNAQAQLKKGGAAEAIKSAEQAAAIIEKLAEQGGVTKQFLTSLAKQAAAAADAGAGQLEARQKIAIESARTQIDLLIERGKALGAIEVGFTVDESAAQLEKRVQSLADALKKSLTDIPVTFKPQPIAQPGGGTTAPVPGFARGGPVFGRGTSKSDSILALVSAGEYVFNARAHNMFGTDMLDRMNRGEWPELARFADGGAVDPTRAMRPINLQWPDGKTSQLHARPDVADDLINMFRLEGLKSGRYRGRR